MGIVSTPAELPQYNPEEPWEYEYGDAFAVGEENNPPVDLYIWTRPFVDQGQVNPKWFSIGQFPAPSTVPGPIGPEGKQGETGERGSRWYAYKTEPPVGIDDSKKWDYALDTETGDVYQLNKDFPNWTLVGNIKGPKGDKGEDSTVPGPQGIQGEEGKQGPKGDPGQFIQVKGELASTDLLPDPDEVDRSTAYLIPDVTGAKHIWLIGENQNGLVWIDAGGFGGGANVKVGDQYISEVDLTNVDNNDIKVYGAHPTYTKQPSISVGTDYINVSYTKPTVRPDGTNKDITSNLTLPLSSSEEIILKGEMGGTQPTIKLHLADDIADKLKVVKYSSSPNVVYGTDGKSAQVTISYSDTTNPGYLVQRQSNGQITVPVGPESVNDAVSKKYVDDTEDVLQGQIDTLDSAMKTYMPKAGGMFTGGITAPNIAFSPMKSVISNPLYVVGQASQGSEMAPVSISQLKATLGVPSAWVSSFNGTTGAINKHMYMHQVRIYGAEGTRNVNVTINFISTSNINAASGTTATSGQTSGTAACTNLRNALSQILTAQSDSDVDYYTMNAIPCAGYYRTSGGNMYPATAIKLINANQTRISYLNTNSNEFSSIVLENCTSWIIYDRIVTLL